MPYLALAVFSKDFGTFGLKIILSVERSEYSFVRFWKMRMLGILKKKKFLVETKAKPCPSCNILH